MDLENENKSILQTHKDGISVKDLSRVEIKDIEQFRHIINDEPQFREQLDSHWKLN